MAMDGGARVALVTGGSRGIGRAVCERLAAEGVRVHFAYRAREDAAREVEEGIGAAGGFARAHRADVGDEGAVRALVEQVLAAEGALHVLVNNAGIVDDQLLALTTLAQFEGVMRTNLTGPFLLIREVLPIMLDQGMGRIVNISSSSVARPGPGQSAYAAAKGGLEALTRATAAEVGHKGITVNAIAVGAVATDMTKRFLPADPKADPANRWGEPSDIAGIVAFLASDAAAYVQGQVLLADGGRALARPRPRR